MFRSQNAIRTDLFSVFDSVGGELQQNYWQYVKSHEVNVNPMSDPSKNPELKTFLLNLESRGYFNDVNPSSEEYRVSISNCSKLQQRYEKAVSKYLDRKGYSAEAPISTEKVAQCESIKEKGNMYFRNGDFRSAVDTYTEAIELYNENPNKYIYLCNRATAAFYLGDYEMTERGMRMRFSLQIDCKECIALNPKHMKAYIRLSASYQKLNRVNEAIQVCEEGLRIDSSCAELSGYLEKLRKTEQPSGNSSFADMMNNMASNPAVREAAQNIANGNMGGLSDLLNNPAISQM